MIIPIKKNTFFLLTLIPIIVIFILICQNLLLNNKLSKYNTKKNNNTTTSTQNSVSVNIYDCEFTITYRIVDLLDNYITEVPEYSYIVVDKFQQLNPITHYIPTELKENLELNKYYEFTYHIRGTGNIENIYDVINNINNSNTSANNYNVTLSIKETDKEGLNQIQQNICG